MKKYLLILKAYFKGSLMNLMEYKFNFISGGTFELVWLFMYLIFIDTIFIHTETVNGWDKYRMLMLTFQGGLMDSVFTFLIVPGLKRLPEMINTGTLDFILLKPLNQRFTISFNEFDIPQIKNIIINITGLTYCFIKLNIRMTSLKLLLYILLSLNGFFLIYSIMFILMSLAFWFMRMDIVMGIGSELITIGNKPMQIYPRLLQKILIFVIPLFVCFNFPILFAVKDLSVSYILYSFAASFIFFLLSNFIFKEGVRRYVGSGS
ncbi:ABC-2 family transporter protein [Treponema socranskii subsp. socranskii VPI DR56BR1116 = ATCC 35536]|uniref:ABC-2 family transporter protein n=1 Tax=Treponema socranskii subsp. socranskii VPI DR56BR1116 = ATCC 35536 TaxID=1125725 RepID=U1FQQ1_TRESO|nr:ABC-2 family transporter protein [Treponema socranskii]ERF61826.1 ABC-2 family transporter protein [Treponema socranskii subsp. socranskii VPI DR56BR1116 = ATCC 35536]ERK03288.1 ABC-2 family transporter protein [Treponema socranskii subsp. socranskii VPI DR56BR1116 = ATCC 35536]